MINKLDLCWLMLISFCLELNYTLLKLVENLAFVDINLLFYPPLLDFLITFWWTYEYSYNSLFLE